MAVTAHITCTTLLSPDSSAEFNYSERGGGVKVLGPGKKWENFQIRTGKNWARSLSLSLSLALALSIQLTLSFSLSVILSTHLSLSLHVYQSQFVCLSVCLSLCQIICLSLQLLPASFCLSVSIIHFG